MKQIAIIENPSKLKPHIKNYPLMMSKKHSMLTI